MYSCLLVFSRLRNTSLFVFSFRRFFLCILSWPSLHFPWARSFGRTSRSYFPTPGRAGCPTPGRAGTCDGWLGWGDAARSLASVTSFLPSSDAALRSAASPSDERAHVRQPQRRASVSASPQPFDKTPQAEPLNIYLLFRSFIENRSFLFALPFFAYCVFFVFKSIISSAFQFFGRKNPCFLFPQTCGTSRIAFFVFLNQLFHRPFKIFL